LVQIGSGQANVVQNGFWLPGFLFPAKSKLCHQPSGKCLAKAKALLKETTVSRQQARGKASINDLVATCVDFCCAPFYYKPSLRHCTLHRMCSNPAKCKHPKTQTEARSRSNSGWSKGNLGQLINPPVCLQGHFVSIRRCAWERPQRLSEREHGRKHGGSKPLVFFIKVKGTNLPIPLSS
jgi:hypothetical protein